MGLQVPYIQKSAKWAQFQYSLQNTIVVARKIIENIL